MTKILITGGRGFIGEHLARYLTRPGKDVTIVDTLPIIDVTKNRDITPYGALSWNHVKQDLATYMRQLMIEAECRSIYPETKPLNLIIHIVKCSSGGDQEQELLNTLYELINLIHYCRVSGCQLVMLQQHQPSISQATTSDLFLRYRLAGLITGALIETTEIFGAYNSTDFSQTLDRLIMKGEVDSSDHDMVHISDVVVGVGRVTEELSAGFSLERYELGTGRLVSAADLSTAAALAGIQVKVDGSSSQRSQVRPELLPSGWRPLVDVLEYVSALHGLSSQTGSSA